MRTSLAIASLLFLGLLLGVPPAAAATPQFFETTIVTDEADYNVPQMESLDILGVHLSEKYQYDADKQVGNDIVSIRFETPSLGVACNAVVRYDLYYQVAGQSVHLYAGLTTAPPTDQQNACVERPADGSGTVVLRGDHVVLLTTRETAGLPVGAQMTDIYATSSTILPAGDPQMHDAAPHANNNAPANAPPTEGLGTYTSNGTFPFVTVVPKTPLEKFSVGGAEVEYEFDFFTRPEVRDDQIRVRFTFPEGWTVSPNRGRTGADPEGQLTGANDGAPSSFAFTTSSTGAAGPGDVASIVMEVITDSGGHVAITTLTTVSTDKIEDANTTFALATKGPFKAGEDQTVSFTVADAAGTALTGVSVSVDVLKDGRRLGTYPATAGEGGVYTAKVQFPSAGDYVLDAYISSLKPSPHQTFAVHAEGGGMAPSLGLAWLALGVCALAWARRR